MSKSMEKYYFIDLCQEKGTILYFLTNIIPDDKSSRKSDNLTFLVSNGHLQTLKSR